MVQTPLGSFNQLFYEKGKKIYIFSKPVDSWLK